jgi:hypothetical protein
MIHPFDIFSCFERSGPPELGRFGSVPSLFGLHADVTECISFTSAAIPCSTSLALSVETRIHAAREHDEAGHLC